MARDPLTKAEARRVIHLAGMIGTERTALRDQAAFAVMLRCGLRSIEVARLDVTDLRETPHGMALRVKEPKGYARKGNPTPPREVGVDGGTLEILSKWLQRRGRVNGPLFCTEDWQRVDPSHWRRKIKKVQRSAGIGKRLHCHGMRHSYARQLHDEGTSVRLIQKALGHASLEVTQTYLDSLGSPEVVAATSKREWR